LYPRNLIPFAPKLMSFETMLDYDNPSLRHPRLLERSNANMKAKITKEERIGV
jgi:hypothetical protein